MKLYPGQEAEYERRHNELQRAYNASQPEPMQRHETAAEYIEIIAALLKIRGVSVELCGSWLWVTGDTRANKDALKAAGCKWASKKMMWYWHPGEYQRHGKKPMSMDYIRTKYGSQVYGRADAEITPA